MEGLLHITEPAHGDLSPMRADISKAMDRKMDLYVLLPLKGQTPKNLVSQIFLEAMARRKRPVFVCSERDLPWVDRAVRDAATTLIPPPFVCTLDRTAFLCPASSKKVDPADVVHHCTGQWRVEGCIYQSSFDLETFRMVKERGGGGIPDQVERLKSKGMCPSRTALDMASESSALIADRSFLFSEGHERVLSFLGGRREDIVLTVCDPLSLIDHLRERFTYSLTGADLSLEKWDPSILGPDDGPTLHVLLGCLSDLLESSHKDVQIDRKDLIELFSSRSGQRGLGNLLAALKRALSLDRFKTIDERIAFKDLYMLIKLWTKHYTAVSRSVEEAEGVRRLVLTVIDVSVITGPILSQFPTTVLFGDTLYPHELYSSILGVKFDRALTRTYGDGRQLNGITVVSIGNVDTSYRNRDQEHFSLIARNLEKVLSTTPGTSLVLFPSYSIMESVCSIASLNGKGKTVLRESRGMGREERDLLIGEAATAKDAMVLSVQGSSIMRAMDEGKLVPDTVVMVGLHIPPPTPCSNQMKLHMQTKLGHDPGHKVSVLMPAITRVMKVVNGMAYRENERSGLVVLMDKRYQDRRVLECFPRFYGIKLLESEQEFSGERFLNGRDG